MPELVVNADLSGFPGAPFPDGVLRSAAESVRDECGWHIAPVVTETVEVEASAGVAVLPSLRVVSISEIRDAKTDRVLTGWRVDKRAGVIFGLPRCAVLEVDLEHGHESCPPALFPVIVEVASTIRAGGRIRQESLGSRSISYAADGTSSNPLVRYKLPARP